ncbi:MAG TPA: 2-oxoglutarate dehydrogenase complex dihydrolipoyllysine-residue succinyltransferase [Spongiibacteraceae bacterium]|nr:2-oxoglutarate dehydrogenase complex dihydrolipoyllysine-residue succinyltransferase [Spongiibacteraceae bacterium]
MSIDIKAPTFPESVADGTIATWHKKPGERVLRDELIVDIETDKVVLEVVAPADGVLSEVLKNEGDTVLSAELIARLDDNAKAAASTPAKAAAGNGSDASAAKASPAAAISNTEQKIAPAARKLIDENRLDAGKIVATGKGGLITKEDVVSYLGAQPAIAAPVAAAPAPIATAVVPDLVIGERVEKRVPMTRLRARIAERLLQASQNTAMLTTFNEVNMQPIMNLRNQYKDLFEKTHNGTRLGFMGFFVKAACEALKRFPAVNASIDGSDIVYHGYQDVGVAVSTDKGLVVPVLRDADQLGIAQIENKIRDFGLRARDGKLAIEEIQGGTFTITNGGVFGSLMSTPILNPPQAAILGMHKTQERPMAVNGQVVILPMMYLALSYDHRLIDGKEAVQFLVAIKELIEDPARILLEI